MEFDETTRLGELLRDYPWLLAEAKKIDGRFALLEGPMGRLLLKNTTVAGLADKAGLEPAEVLDKLREMIRDHG